MAFAEHGFAGARVYRICRKARVNQRMLYHYFGSKLGLYKAVYWGLTDWMVKRVMEALTDKGEPEPLDAFTTIVTTQMDLMMQGPTYSRIALHTALDGVSVYDEINRQGDPETLVRAAFLGSLRRGQDKRGIAEPESSVNALGLAVTFLLVYPGFKSRFTESLDSRGIPPQEQDHYVANQIARLLIPAVGRKPDKHRPSS